MINLPEFHACSFFFSLSFIYLLYILYLFFRKYLYACETSLIGILSQSQLVWVDGDPM